MSSTQDIDEDFFPVLHAVSAELGTEAILLLRVWMAESGVRADAHNNGPETVIDKITKLRRKATDEERYHASGIFQAMPKTLPGIGWSKGHAAFRKLSATEQLPYARKYYLPHRGFLKTVGGIYVSTFLPAFVQYANDPDFVLTAKDGPLPWAYGPNAVFDANKDLRITVGELEQAVERNCRGARWSELASRCNGTLVMVADFDEIDLRTIAGIQRALAKLGYDPGAPDGIPGPRTRGAVTAFQTARGLACDGIVGPLTRAALEIALSSLEA